MAKFVSSKNPVSSRALKRKPCGSVVLRHYGRTDLRFTRTNGGWLRERMDITSERPSVVTSAAVAAECNGAIGCNESWAKVY